MVPLGTKAMLSNTFLIQGKGKVMTVTEYREHDEGVVMNQDDIVALATDVFVNVGNLWAAFGGDDFKMIGVKSIYMKGTDYRDGFSEGDPIPGGLAGGIADSKNELGDEVALVLQRRTGLRGRSFQGRMFWPGLAELVNDNGYLAVSMYGAADALAAWLGSDYTCGGAGGVAGTIWHARHYISPKTADDGSGGTIDIPGDFKPVVDVRYRNKLSTRKDRSIVGAIWAR